MSLLDRMELGVERVRDRLLRVTRALQAARIPYAVVGGNAVAAWVARADIAAVRNTQDVDILLARPDLARAQEALARVGFVHRHTGGMDMFLDGAAATARDAVHVIFADEKVRPEHTGPAPSLEEATRELGAFDVISLEALVRMKLTSYRLKDQVHLQDLIAVRLVDASWPARFAEPLRARLQTLLDNPES